MKVQQFILSFQSYMALGQPSAAEAIAAQMDKFARDFIASTNFVRKNSKRQLWCP
jgi:hypothetical protein